MDRLARRIEQVLALARSDAGIAPFASQHASAIIAQRIDAASTLFEDRGVELTSGLDEGVFVAAPTGVIARLIDELLGNALAYASSRVHVEFRQVGREVELSVADDGPGVPRAERDAIFERFNRGSAPFPAAVDSDSRWCGSQ